MINYWIAPGLDCGVSAKKNSGDFFMHFLMHKTISFFKISEDQFLSNSRKKNIVQARIFFTNYLRKKDKSFFTLKKIGLFFYKHHSTIINYIDSFDNDFKNFKYFREKFNAFEQFVKLNRCK